jgi:hypothetical protein
VRYSEHEFYPFKNVFMIIMYLVTCISFVICAAVFLSRVHTEYSVNFKCRTNYLYMHGSVPGVSNVV